MAENVQNLLQNNNRHIQEGQLTPRKINEEFHKKIHHNKNTKSQRQGENLDDNKRKMTHHVQGNNINGVLLRKNKARELWVNLLKFVLE